MKLGAEREIEREGERWEERERERDYLFLNDAFLT